MSNIYIDPKAIAFADSTLGVRMWTERASRHTAYRALIQYIVENPRELSEDELDKIDAIYTDGDGGAKAYQAAFAESLRLAFTPPTPDVPEKIVAIIDKHRRIYINGGRFPNEDDIRAFAVEAYEAGKGER